MNLKQINEFRTSHGLTPLQAPVKKRAQAANQAKRAQECRDLKAKRGTRSK
jgi:hypothetical protein